MLHRTAILTLLFALLICAGCAPALADARFAVDTATRVYERVEPAVEKQRAEDGNACFERGGGSAVVEACLVDVRSRWVTVRAASTDAYRLLVTAQATVGTAEAAAALKQSVSMSRVIAVVMAALDAAWKLQEAVVGMKPAKSGP